MSPEARAAVALVLTGVLVLTVLAVVALSHGINGKTTVTVATGIGALIGYGLRVLQSSRRDRKGKDVNATEQG